MAYDFLISILASLLVALAFYLIEVLKKSSIVICADPVVLIENEGAPSNILNDARIKEKYVLIKVLNKRSFFGITRNPARGVHGNITFFSEFKVPVCEKPMTGRWHYLQKPFIHLYPKGFDDKGKIQTAVGISQELFRNSEYIDIYSGDYELFGVALKIDGESGAYGYCNESYLENHRHKSYSLNKGTHIIRIVIKWDSGISHKEFLLRDGGSIDTFFMIDSSFIK